MKENDNTSHMFLLQDEKKYALFLKVIESDLIVSQREKDNASQQLSKCKDMHHTLLNFSLMQAIGNMQRFKGIKGDRLDVFIYELDKYYRGLSTLLQKKLLLMKL